MIDWISMQSAFFAENPLLAMENLEVEGSAAPSGTNRDRNLASVNHVIDSYNEALKISDRAQHYIYQERGLIDPEAVDALGIGFSDRSLGKEHLLNGETPEGAAVRGELQRLGLLSPSGHERFRGCITFPLYDAAGQIVSVYGRRIGPKYQSGSKAYEWWEYEPGGLFNRQALWEFDNLILCKTPLEAASLWCAGFRNAVATLGMRGLNDEHLEAFESHGIQRLDMAFGASQFAHSNACLISQAALVIGIECRELQLTNGADINQMLLSPEIGVAGIAELIHSAKPCKQTYEQLQWEVTHGRQ